MRNLCILAWDVRDVSGTKVTGAAPRTRSSCIADALAGRATRGIMQMRFGDRRKPRRVKLVAANYRMEIIPIRRNRDRATRNGDCSISGILAGESDRKARKRDPYQLIEQIETGNTGSPASWKSPSAGESSDHRIN